MGQAFLLSFIMGKIIKLGVVAKECSAQIVIQEGWIISWKNGHNHKPEELENILSVEFEDEIVQKYFKN